jgi:uncharacterized Fe-S cluster-containing radical SAM superfamily protein
MSDVHRRAGIDLEARRVLVADLRGSEQEQDLTVPPNCEGLGRIRHFRRRASSYWPANPLPIDPVVRALGLDPTEVLRAQVFQNAICNWRCWYCYVPFNLLSAPRAHSKWATAADLLDLYERETPFAPVIDLSGGQPDLTPEWVVWMIQELVARRLADRVYLWSDDNLSNDFFWRFLSDAQRELIVSHPMYSRVCCFKGFSSESFSFNTMAKPELFERQFDLMGRLIATGMNLYGYVTFTTPSRTNLASQMSVFVDKLQALHANLPLRIVPLEIQPFSPVKARLDAARSDAIVIQREVVDLWVAELDRRFSSADRRQAIVDVPLN